MRNHPAARFLAATLLLAPLAALPAGLNAQRSAAALSLGVLIVPAAPAFVVVPDVRGQTLSGAAARVSVAGLVPRHAASTPGNVDTSPVRRQWPRAGQRVPQGTVVALELATPLAALSSTAPMAAGSRPAAPAAAESQALTRLARTSLTSVSSSPAERARWKTAVAWAFTAVVAVAAAALPRRKQDRPVAAARSAAGENRTASTPPSPADATFDSAGPARAPHLRTRRGARHLVAVAPGSIGAGAHR
ncbi:MAG TPA: PASTA domain-containing protein [Longimicrobium sp.]|nr:PASTA domain-containing protein [Longimicrobium sp.]